MDAQAPERRRPFPEVAIRASRPGDAEEIAALCNLPGYRFGTLRTPYQSPEDVRKWLDSRSPTSIGLVAVAEERIVGTGGFERYPGRRSHAGQVALGVRDDSTRRGVGTALLRALIDTAENWLGVTRIDLTVFVDNTPAVALYERHGFAVRTLRAYAFRDGAFVDAYTMAKLTRHRELVPASSPA